jgi:peroxiredoxin
MAWFGPALVSLVILTPTSGSSLPVRPIADFALPDQHGKIHWLHDWRQSKLIVVVFVGVDCPLAELYAPRLVNLANELASKQVALLAIDSNEHDSAAEIARYADTHHIPFPILKDAGQTVADSLGATRTPEAFVLDERRVLRYRGRIDNQYAIGVRRAQPGRCDLTVAVEELLSGRPVSRPVTQASGCMIDRQAPPHTSALTYCRDIAPLLREHCVACHRPGQIAPFALLTYEQVKRRARSIGLAVADGRMPPWYADPSHGKFANDVHLSEDEKACIQAWVRSGCPEGNPADLPPARQFTDGWNISRPDVVVSIPEPFTIPAEGTIEYQYFEVDPGFREDKWVRAAEIRPGNRAVVHHCLVFLKQPGSTKVFAMGALGSYCLEAMAVGSPPTQLPDGMAKLVPAGSRFLFVVHYTPIGKVQTDRTSIGLVFAEPGKVRKEVATKLLTDPELCIPPRAADHRIEKTYRMPGDVVLLSMFPHMHLRGKSFRYEVDYPDGASEILLDVPRYDFNWQNKYVLAEPKYLPRGSLLRCTAHYDNSENNPHNPDPDATVRAGPQSWDEMFNGYFDFALADEDRTQLPSPMALDRAVARRVWTLLGMLVVLLLSAGLLLVDRLRRGPNFSLRKRLRNRHF